LTNKSRQYGLAMALCGGILNADAGKNFLDFDGPAGPVTTWGIY
jgi:hypothetical protein